jgi:hypothetical protein
VVARFRRAVSRTGVFRRAITYPHSLSHLPTAYVQHPYAH